MRYRHRYFVMSIFSCRLRHDSRLRYLVLLRKRDIFLLCIFEFPPRARVQDKGWPGRSRTWHTRAREQWWSLPMARRYFIISFETHAYTSACTQGALAQSILRITACHDVVPTSPIKCRINFGVRRISDSARAGVRMDSAGESLFSKRR